MFEKIKKIISNVQHLDEDIITLKTSLSDLKVDSLDFFEIVSCIEDEFNIVIDGYDIEKISNIEDLICIIDKKKLKDDIYEEK